MNADPNGLRYRLRDGFLSAAVVAIVLVLGGAFVKWHFYWPSEWDQATRSAFFAIEIFVGVGVALTDVSHD